jgi:hypothetical protein
MIWSNNLTVNLCSHVGSLFLTVLESVSKQAQPVADLAVELNTLKDKARSAMITGDALGVAQLADYTMIWLKWPLYTQSGHW